MALLTDQGYQLLSRAEWRSLIVADYKKALELSDIDDSATSALGNIIDSQADRLYSLDQLGLALYNSGFRTKATGVSLDNVLANIGISRIKASPSIAIIHLGNSSNSITSVPINSLVSQSGSSVQWQLIDSVDIPAADTVNLVNLDIDAIEWQSDTTVRYTFNGSPDLSNVVALNFLFVEDATDELHNGYFFIAAVDIGAYWIEIRNLKITDNTHDEASDSPANASVLTSVSAQIRSVLSGPYSATEESINTILNPVAGWDVVRNYDIAQVGTNRESDADAKIRSGISAISAEGGTLLACLDLVSQVQGVTFAAGRENRTNLNPDVNGLKAHSIELTVIGGEDIDVASSILNTKPAGIETNGTEEYVFNNAYGFNESITIKWNRATEIELAFIINLTIDSDYPSNGDDSVKLLVKAYIDSLNNGADVINNKVEGATFSIPGITDIEVLQAIKPTTPISSANIVIAANERAKVDNTDITVNS